MNKKAFQLPVEEVEKEYQVPSIEEGLDESQVKENLKQYGYNQLTANKTSKWQILLRQFHNVIIYILMFSAFLTLLMGHYSDAIIIGIVVVVNALIGYLQEVNASNRRTKQIKELHAISLLKGV